MQTLLAIPIFNEAKYLQGVLAKVRSHIADILVIDDGSTDETARLLAAEERIFRIRHPANRGYGQSLIDAFEFAGRHGYDWLITMDCDEQHEPAHIPEFLAAIREDDADVISGSRYLRQSDDDNRPPHDRQTINMCITRLLNNALGMRITDAFCGFKAYRVAALARLHLTVPGYAMPLQFWVQATRAGLRIRELPVRLIYKDPKRHFGGNLDDPRDRLWHYLDVLATEMGIRPMPPAAAEPGENTCCTSRQC
jgi:glycosyltransferase involved in cell wall biosynthesis